MSYDVIATELFEKKLKKLSNKYPSLKEDLLPIIDTLSENPKIGTPLGKNCYKIRFIIKSKTKGKSGSGRIITFVRFIKNIVYLIDIYDKSARENISDKELKELINLIAE